MSKSTTGILETSVLMVLREVERLKGPPIAGQVQSAAGRRASAEAGIGLGRIAKVLLSLEFKRLAKELPGKQFVKTEN